MSFSRRKFLRAGTLVAISAGFPLRSVIAGTLNPLSSLSSANADSKAGSYLDRETFSRQLNTKFSFSRENAEPVAVKLIEVNDLAPRSTRRSVATGKECFTVVFIGSNNPPLRQETYTVTHESLGKFDMFVVPIANSRNGRYYEAVFNRLH